ncbi:bifunctional DNA-formamidopyrimidine glycosylase/DNA-(apurinic or apyrimidinic site) lyase [Candidatus Gottesmanbacteria bacterium]|nr:bifunctional DNA-formamidopyrimidine glycosylase/DNA-(apurinic or apyrimidinic site) lyase [Candidatus Gottesmanbacteria bacterium]
MPELPEVETIVNDLEHTIVGAKIVDFWENSPKQVVPTVEEVKQAVVGSTIVEVGRRAKLIVFKLNYYSSIRQQAGRSLKGSSRRVRLDSNNNIFLVIHLKMSGRLVLRKKGDLPDPYVRAIFYLNNNTSFWGGSASWRRRLQNRFWTSQNDDGTELELRFCDRRKFGYVRLFKDKQDLTKWTLEKLGPEPFSKEFTFSYLYKIFRHKNTNIKSALLDQSLIAGIGNIYANEALFLAKIKPTRKAKSLKIKSLKSLKECIIKVLKKGIKYRGSSSRDESYRDLYGELGNYQNHFLVYEKKGKKCPNGCGGVIEYNKVNGRGTFWCPRCQK